MNLEYSEGRIYPKGVAAAVRKIVYGATQEPMVRAQVLASVAACAALDTLGLPVTPATVKRMSLAIVQGINYEADLMREEQHEATKQDLRPQTGLPPGAGDQQEAEEGPGSQGTVG